MPKKPVPDSGELNRRGGANPRIGGTWTHGTAAAIPRTIDRWAKALSVAA